MNLGTRAAWEKLGYDLWRAAVPGGWLVAGFQGTSSQGLVFVPDPDHAWNGEALWPAGKGPSVGERGALSFPDDVS